MSLPAGSLFGANTDRNLNYLRTGVPNALVHNVTVSTEQVTMAVKPHVYTMKIQKLEFRQKYRLSSTNLP
jgi:hypothetical protein